MRSKDMPKFKPLTKFEKETVNDLFTAYLFYEKINEQGDRQYTCSHCGKTFIIPALCRTTTDEIYELQHAVHNEKYHHCPKCKAQVVIKNKGKAKSCQNLYEEQRVCIIHTAGHDVVHIQCFDAVKRYTGSYNPPIEWYEQSKYVLTPTKQEKFQKHWYFGWTGCTELSEPFPRRNAMGYYADNSYTVIGLNKLKNTFLKYNMLCEYAERRREWLLNACSDLMQAEIKMIKYLVYFAKYPQIEMLQKLEHYDVVENLVEAGLKSFPHVNWKAKSIYGFFKMSKREYKEFTAAGGTLKLLDSRKTVRKIINNPTWDKVAEYVKKCDGEHYLNWAIEEMKKHSFPIKEGVDYLIKQAANRSKSFPTVFSEYRDYIKMAAELNYDIVNPVVYFPKDLKTAHDNANQNHLVLLQERQAAAEKKATAEYRKIKKQYIKQYEFSDGVFSIVIPSGINDIIREGKLQQHCVGGYAHRHVNGTLTICFLRKTNDIETPLYTIEMHGKALTQVQGKRNDTPLTPEAKAFFDTWLEWVRNGSKRNKDGTPKLLMAAANKTA